MSQSPEPGKLIHIYDELTENKPGIKTEVYKKYLMKWGIEKEMIERICREIDPTGSGVITRDALCAGLRFWPNRPEILREVKVLDSDMSLMKQESIILLILEVAVENRPKKETVNEIKRRIEKIYGSGWTVYVADGRYWSVCAHMQGTNLAFVYKNHVYGVYRVPNSE